MNRTPKFFFTLLKSLKNGGQKLFRSKLPTISLGRSLILCAGIAVLLSIPFHQGHYAFGDIGDCFWGGPNEETAYTAPYHRGFGDNLSSASAPQMNLGAPPPAVPVQASPGNQAMSIPQAAIPTITVPMGAVGTVGQPATNPNAPCPDQTAQMPQLPPGTELMYVLPTACQPDACLNGVQGTPAQATQVVPAGTPGAIPVAVRLMTVRRPVRKWVWDCGPVTDTVNTLVRVVDPRTGKVVQTCCKTQEVPQCDFLIPIPHQREVITYETVTVKVATPIQLKPAASAGTGTMVNAPGAVSISQNSVNIKAPPAPAAQAFQRTNRPTDSWGEVSSGSHTTLVLPN